MISNFDPMWLLTPDITSHRDWNNLVTKKTKYFYVRGISSFLELTNKKRTKTDMHSTSVRNATVELVNSWGDWGAQEEHYFDSSKISQNQLRDATVRVPLMFDKACMVVAQCYQNYLEIMPKENGFYSASPLSQMYVEPAVYYLVDFDKAGYEQLFKNNSEKRNLLRVLTGQETHKVFEEMAEGYTVTLRMALRFKAAMIHLFGPDVVDNVGEVSASMHKSHSKGRAPSERVDTEITEDSLGDCPQEVREFLMHPAEALLDYDKILKRDKTVKDIRLEILDESIKSGAARTRAEWICLESQEFRRRAGGMPLGRQMAADIVALASSGAAPRQAFLDFEEKHQQQFEMVERVFANSEATAKEVEEKDAFLAQIKDAF